MSQRRSRGNRLARTAAATAVVLVAAGLAGTGHASAAPPDLSQDGRARPSLQGEGRLDGRPRTLQAQRGQQAFLLKLETRATHVVYRRSLRHGKAAARAAARAQLDTVEAGQDRVTGALPRGSKVLYRTHSFLSGVAVRTDVRNRDALERIDGVAAVYPIAAKRPSNSYAVPLVGGGAAWQGFGNRGEGTTIAIIDTGLDYTHANFGGPGTSTAYAVEHAAEDQPANPAYFPSDTIIGGYDFVGDDYDSSAPPPQAPGDPTPVPAPDPNPLDCHGHGSHVGGTAAGRGVNADGSTYAGPYDATTPFAAMRIGPGMAPEAKLYGFRVFGCAGSTDVTGAALERAADPNGDGDTSDHVDVVNMSLGSDFGSPLDGDSVLSNELAEQVGINVVVASGNGGDLYDVGGSPGNAVRTIAVANSTDEYSQLDALHVTGPAAAAGDYGAQRSIAYDWDSRPDLTGVVAQVTDPGNLEGCDPLSPADAAAVAGKVAWVEWTNVGGAIQCGSVQRSRNLADAGAIGFVFASDEDLFSAGITGSTTIPGVMITRAAGDALRPRLASGVTVGGTTPNGFRQIIPGNNDLVNPSSSRGIRVEGGVKPDVTAVGTSVFSTGVGTGSEGSNSSGTSMAAPMVAGLASLVVSEHPDWTTEEVKADIMNTSGQDLFTGQNHTGERYAPNRVGAGRIDAVRALQNDVLAYVTDDPGAVSASFGPLEVTEPTSLTKTVRVSNKGASAATYGVSYDALTTIPGVEYSVSPAYVTVAPGSSEELTLTLEIDPAQLTKTIDPTMSRTQLDVPRGFLADASGRVVLTSTDGRPDLRVPVYSAPRPASDMTQPSALTLPSGPVQSGALALTGTGVDQGTGAEAVRSLTSAFELQAESGQVPTCTAQLTSGCVHNQDERSADLQYVGTTSEFFGDDPIADGFGYFAVTTHGPWQTAASQNEFDILLNTDADPEPDFVTVNTRFTDTDVLVSATFDLESGANVDVQAINDAWLFGAGGIEQLDTALFDSNVMVLPVWLGALGITEADSRIEYSIEAYSTQADSPVDVVEGLTVDLLEPGIETGEGDGTFLYPDVGGEVLPITRNRDAYRADGGLGALVLHYHNAVGAKAQKVTLSSQKAPSAVSLDLVPTQVTAGETVTATVTVANTENRVPTGNVVVRSDARTFRSAPLDDTGTAKVTFKARPAGRHSVVAHYSGDDTYSAGTSAPVSLTVKKIRPTVSLKLPKRVKKGRPVTATVSVETVNGLVPKGVVLVKHGTRTLNRGVLRDGTAKITFTLHRRKTFTIRAKYLGDSNYRSGFSPDRRLRVV